MKKIYKVTGLDCAHCAANFEAVVKKTHGVTDAKVNFLLEKMIITCEDEKAAQAAIEAGKKAFPDCVVQGV